MRYVFTVWVRLMFNEWVTLKQWQENFKLDNVHGNIIDCTVCKYTGQ